MIYSWQKSQWRHLMQRKAMLPHAILLRGGAGIGKDDFALHLAQALLCHQAGEESACGTCSSCLWFQEDAHPDFKCITPTDDSEDTASKKKTKKTQISVAQIRQLYAFLSLSTHQVQGKRIILISPAEALNLNAANALLKMLEEPPANTLFLLVTSQPQRLLATIISRCQVLNFSIPPKHDAIEWLRSQQVSNPQTLLTYAGGAPLAALRIEGQLAVNQQLIQQLSKGRKLDPFSTAPLFLASGMERAVDVIQKWIFDLLHFRLTNTVHYHAQQLQALQVLAKSVNLGGLLQFERSLLEAKKSANHPLSNEMQLEQLLLQYVHVFNI